MLGQFKSTRIVNIQSNFTLLKCPIPEWLWLIIVFFDNSYGWNSDHRKFVRKVVDLSNSVKVVATNFRRENDPMNLFKVSQYGTTWKLHYQVENTCLSGGKNENLMMYVFVKTGEPTKTRLPSTRVLHVDKSYEVAMNQFEKGFNHHFLEHECSEFLLLGEEGVLSTHPIWHNRASFFLSKYDKVSQHVGRVVENENNNCYANSILAALCNLPIVREAIRRSIPSFPRIEDIISKKSVETALSFIMKVYVESIKSTKSSFLLPYRNKFFKKGKNEKYFDIGIAFNQILFPPTRGGIYPMSDQGEWLVQIFFRCLNEMQNPILRDLFTFENMSSIRTSCSYKGGPRNSVRSELLELKIGNEHLNGRKSINELLNLYVADEVLTDFTMHFKAEVNGEIGTILKNHPAAFVRIGPDPVIGPCDIVFDPNARELATVHSIDNPHIYVFHHVSNNCKICIYFKKNFMNMFSLRVEIK